MTAAQVGQKIKDKWGQFYHKVKSILENKNSLFYYFLFLFGLAFVMSIYFFFKNDFTLPFGGDYTEEQYPFYTNGYDDWWHFFRTGEFPLWDSNTVLGVNNIGSNSFYYFFNPFFLALLFTPRPWIPTTMAFFLMIKIALSGLTFRYFLKKLGVEEKTARIYGIAYAFCGWNLFYLWFNHFMEVVVVFPLILAGIEDVLQKKNPKLLMISVFLMGISNYFFLVISCFAGVCYAGFRYFQLLPKWKKQDWWQKLLLGILGFGTGILMCCFVLLPCLSAIQNTGRVESADWLPSLQTYWDEKNWEMLLQTLFQFNSPEKAWYPLASFFYSPAGCFSHNLFEYHYYNNALSSLFVYTPLILSLFPALMTSIKQKKYSHILAFGLIVFMLFTPWTYYLFTGFTQDYGRWELFPVAILIAYLACNHKNLKDTPKREWFASYVICMILMGLVTIYANQYTLDHPEKVYAWNDNGFQILYQFAWLTFIFLFIIFFYKKEDFDYRFAVSIIIEVIIVGNICYAHQMTNIQYVAGGSENLRQINQISEKIRDLPENDHSFYRIYSDTANRSNNNLGMRANYNGVGGFHSLYNFNTKDFLNWSRMLYSTDTWTLGEHEKRAELDEFLGVKYYILRDYNNKGFVQQTNVPYGYTYREDLSTHGQMVFENQYWIPYGYAYDSLYLASDMKIPYTMNNQILNDEILLNHAIVYSDDYQIEEVVQEQWEDFPLARTLSYAGSFYELHPTSLNKDRKTVVKRYDNEYKIAFNGYDALYPLSYEGEGRTRDSYGQYTVVTPFRWKEVELTGTPYTYYTRYEVTRDKENSYFCSNASKEEKCGLYLNTKLYSYLTIWMFGETGNLITYDSQQVSYYNGKVVRPFYVTEPVKKIILQPNYNEGANSGVYPPDFGRIYEKYESTYKEGLQKFFDSPLTDIRVTTNTAHFKTNFSKKKIVVLQTAYDPGWSLKRTKDGVSEEVPIYSLNGGFVGFIAEPGDTSYDLSYWTPSLSAGLACSAAGFVLFTCTSGFFYYKKKKKKTTSAA